MTTPRVDLAGFEGLGLIVKDPDGAVFTNQVAGYSCLHPEVRGIFVPLPDADATTHATALRELFEDGDWHSLDEESAARIEGVLRRGCLSALLVDRSRLAESFEGWIHVEIRDDLIEITEGFAGRLGVLTWKNSD